jgi:cytochrome c
MKIVAILIIAVSAWAFEGNIERGRELFNSKTLGTNQKSCASCHPKGSKLQKAASYNDKRLAGIVNGCIEGMLAGKPLPPASEDMASLISYLRTFAPPQR